MPLKIPHLPAVQDITSRLIKRSIVLVQKIDQPRLSAAAQQRQVLRSLLRRSAATAIGKHYQFGQLQKNKQLFAAYQQQLPIHDYDSIFNQWWHRSLEGEADVCWPGSVRYFALSSGTAGAASKYIPVTFAMTRAMRHAALRMFACLPKYKLPDSFFGKDWLMIGGSASLQKLPTGAYAGDLSGINAGRPPVWVRRYYKPGIAVARLPNWDQRVKAIVQQAPKWDVAAMMGIPSWVQLTLEHIIAHHKLDNIHELWPNLQVFATGGVAFEPYRKSFEQLLREPLHYMDSYLASEGFVAFQSRPDTHAMKMVLDNGIFYEFVPFNDDNFDEEGMPKPGAQALTIEDVESGVDYALLLSSCAGAWRYLIGDTVRFTDLARQEIIISGRTKHFLSMCGEHLSVDNMNKAIMQVEQRLNLAISEFTVGGIKAGGHFGHHWYVGCQQPPADSQLFLQLLDQALMEVNDDYKAERSAMLDAPKVTFLPVQVFNDWQRERGRLNGQSKIPRVMKGSQLAGWQHFLEEKNI